MLGIPYHEFLAVLPSTFPVMLHPTEHKQPLIGSAMNTEYELRMQEAFHATNSPMFNSKFSEYS